MKDASAESGWVPPNEFDEYRLVRRLGHGGMGDVYLGYEQSLDRHVAIKVLPAELARDLGRQIIVTVAAADQHGACQHAQRELAPGAAHARTLPKRRSRLRYSRIAFRYSFLSKSGQYFFVM